MPISFISFAFTLLSMLTSFPLHFSSCHFVWFTSRRKPLPRLSSWCCFCYTFSLTPPSATKGPLILTVNMKTKNVMREETTSGETTSYCSNIYIPFCFNRTTKNIDRENKWETQRDRNMSQVKRESTVISIGNLERLWKYLETHSLWDKSYSHRLLPHQFFLSKWCLIKTLFLIERLCSIVFYSERHILFCSFDEGFTGGSRRDLHPLPFSLFTATLHLFRYFFPYLFLIPVASFSENMRGNIFSPSLSTFKYRQDTSQVYRKRKRPKDNLENVWKFKKGLKIL